MTDLIDSVGPLLGLAAFLGLSILAFLTFQQAREVRRLREWAGRAPERAEEAAQATAAAVEARGEQPDEATGGEEPEAPTTAHAGLGTVAAFFDDLRERGAAAWTALDRRSPVDARYFLVVAAAAVIAAAVLTSGFGVFEGDGDGRGEERAGKEKGGAGRQEEEKLEVSVLNATQDDTATPVIAGVPGLADGVAKEIVKPAGFAVGERTDARSGFAESVIMYEPEAEETALELADAVTDTLGETEVQPIIDEVADRADGAAVVLVVGRDDADALG